METSDLQAIATHTRSVREAGIALVLGSLVLAAFLFIPLKTVPPTPAAVAAAVAPDTYSSVAIQAQSAIVYDLSTKQVLYAKDTNAQLPLASLTKLLTVYSAIHELGPSSLVTIPQAATDVDAPKAFTPGDTFVLSDLARLTLTGSLNDGAEALADAAAREANTTVPALLASVANSLNLSETYALNGSGLDLNTAISGGYGSAHDIAILAGALVAEAPTIALATTADSATASTVSGETYTVQNTNPNVLYAPRLLLSKTGYTDLAGGNLVLVFDAGIDHPVVVVVLGSTEDARFTDADALVAATLAHFAGTSSL